MGKYWQAIIGIIFFQACREPAGNVVVEPVPKHAAGISIVVSVTGKQQVLIRDKEVPVAKVDSVLQNIIDSAGERKISSTIVIVADSMANYGIVYDIIRYSKKAGAKAIVRE